MADPTKTASCTVTVEALPETRPSALVYDTDSKTYWSDFSTNAPESWTKASEEAAGAYMAGALHEGELLLHDGKTMYGVDPTPLRSLPMARSLPPGSGLTPQPAR